MRCALLGVYYQGRIDPPKAGRGMQLSYILYRGRNARRLLNLNQNLTSVMA